jgi:hypothetical protein
VPDAAGWSGARVALYPVDKRALSDAAWPGMPHPSPLSASAALFLVAALSACSPDKPPETPESTASTAEADSPPKADKDKGEAKAEANPDTGEAPPQPPKADVDKAMSLDTYEMTPSDCNALGRHYGEVARNDQMAALSPKLTEKQRSATAAQVDKVVGKLEESWTNGCHASLVNKAVDHDAIKCALAAKTVKDFDVCINGGSGTPQAAGKPQGKKKK